MSETNSEPHGNTRRSVRLPIRLPIKIRGIAAGNEPFNESTWTLTVSEHGALIATAHRPAVGDIVEIENVVLSLTAKARVISVEEERFPREMAVELLEPQNIWGVQFSDSPRPAETQDLQPPPAMPGPAAVPAERPALPAPPNSGPAVAASWDESVAHLESNEKRAGALEQQIDALQECVRNSRAELDSLLAKFQELQLAWQSEVERAKGSIRTLIESSAQHVAQELQQRLEKQAQAGAVEYVDALRKRLEQEAAAAAGNLSTQANTTLSTLMQDYVSTTRAELARTLVQFKKKGAETVLSHLQRSAEEIRDDSVRKLRQHAEGSLEQLREELTAAGDALRDDLNRQAIRTVREALENLGRKTHDASREYTQLLDSRLREFRQKAESRQAAPTSLDLTMQPDLQPTKLVGR